jgi:hypothetical protein
MLANLLNVGCRLLQNGTMEVMFLSAVEYRFRFLLDIIPSVSLSNWETKRNGDKRWAPLNLHW